MDTEQIRELDPFEFEYFVASRWEKRGYSVAVTPGTSDKGIDIYAEKDGKEEVIQAKRYDKKNKIGSGDVRKYATLYLQEDVDDVVLVTSGFFTEPAIELAQDLAVTLYDIDDLVTLLEMETEQKQREEYLRSEIESLPRLQLKRTLNQSTCILQTLVGKTVFQIDPTAEDSVDDYLKNRRNLVTLQGNFAYLSGRYHVISQDLNDQEYTDEYTSIADELQTITSDISQNFADLVRILDRSLNLLLTKETKIEPCSTPGLSASDLSFKCTRPLEKIPDENITYCDEKVARIGDLFDRISDLAPAYNNVRVRPQSQDEEK